MQALIVGSREKPKVVLVPQSSEDVQAIDALKSNYNGDFPMAIVGSLHLGYSQDGFVIDIEPSSDTPMPQ